MGWGSGDISLFAAEEIVRDSASCSVFYNVFDFLYFGQETPPHNAQAIMSNIQLYSVGTRTFIFLVLLGYKVTVWQFLPAYKGLEAALRRNG